MHSNTQDHSRYDLNMGGHQPASHTTSITTNTTIGPAGKQPSPPPAEPSSFLTVHELVSNRALPLLGAAAYLIASVGTTTTDETFTV